MERLGTGARPQKRKARPALTVGRPIFEQALAGGKFDFPHIMQARAWGNALMADRNRWDIERRRGGLFSGRRLKKADADAALKRALEALEGGAE